MAGIINEKMKSVGIDKVRPHPANPRQGDVGAIHESIEANGFYGAIVVQKSTGHILAGNHRWMAAKEAGLDTVPVIYVDVDDERAMRILLADNRTSDVSTYDDNALVQLLDHLAATDAGLAGTGYDPDAFGEMLAALPTSAVPVDPANDPEAEWDGMPEYEHEDKRPYRTIYVHFRSEEDVEEFGRMIGQKLTDKTKSIWHPALVRNDFMTEQWVADGEKDAA